MAQIRSFTVTGRSMVPNVLPGDWLLGTSEGGFRFGDVVIIDRGERWVAHRVVRTRRGYGWEMGDGTAEANRFESTQVLARVTVVVGRTGRKDLTTLPARIHGRIWATRLLIRYLSKRAHAIFAQQP